MIVVKRYLFIAAGISALFSALGFFVGNKTLALAVFPVLIAALFLLALAKKYMRPFAAAVIIGLAFFSYSSLIYCFEVEPVRRLDGVRASVTGYICEEPEFYDSRAVYYVKTDFISVNGAPQNIKLKLVSDTADGFKTGDGITALVSFYESDSKYLTSSYSDGIYIGSYALSIAKNEKSAHKGLYNAAVALRRKTRHKIGALYSGDCRGFLTALLLGDRSYMSDRALENFKNCGITHLIAISGLHLGIIIGTLDRVLKRLLGPRLLRTAIVTAAVFTLMAVTGFSPSVIRAGIMYLFTLSGELFGRTSDRLNALGAAAIIMLAANPFLWANAGFVLSFLSVIGIIVFSEKIDEFLRKPIENSKHFAESDPSLIKKCLLSALDSISVSLAASAATAPALFVMFGEFSPLSVIATFLTVVLVSPVLILLIISLFLNFSLLSPISLALSKVVSLLCGYILWVAETLARLPFARISAGGAIASVFVFSALSVLGAAVLSLGFGMRKSRQRHFSAVSAVSVLCAVFLSPLLLPINYKISLPSTPEGFSAVVSYKDDAVVIGCGNDKSDFYSISHEISRLGIESLNAVILLDGCGDCLENAQKLASEYDGTEIYGDEQNGKTVPEEIRGLDFEFGEKAKVVSLCGEEEFAVQMNIMDLKIIFCSGRYYSEDSEFDLALATPAAAKRWSRRAKITVVSAENADKPPLPSSRNLSSNELYLLTEPCEVRINKKQHISVWTE